MVIEHLEAPAGHAGRRRRLSLSRRDPLCLLLLRPIKTLGPVTVASSTRLSQHQRGHFGELSNF